MAALGTSLIGTHALGDLAHKALVFSVMELKESKIQVVPVPHSLEKGFGKVSH